MRRCGQLFFTPARPAKASEHALNPLAKSSFQTPRRFSVVSFSWAKIEALHKITPPSAAQAELKGSGRKSMDWCVYMILCDDHSIYVGVSNNVNARYAKH